MTGTIYLVGQGDNLQELTETPYDSEAVLQELLAKYPKLLAGEQIDSDSPRRWLLISREVGLPGEEDGVSEEDAGASVQGSLFTG